MLQLNTHLYQIQKFASFIRESRSSLNMGMRSLCKRLVAMLKARQGLDVRPPLYSQSNIWRLLD